MALKTRTRGALIPSAATRDLGQMGPAMRALNERQRAFVHAMVDSGMVNHTRCALAAGYTGDAVVLRVTAHRLAHDDRVQAAIQEEARKRITSGSLMAVNTLLQIAESPVHKDQLKAVEMILNRSGLHALSEHKVTIEKQGGTPAEVIAQIKDLASTLGLDPVRLLGSHGLKRLPKPEDVPVDAEYSEVQDVHAASHTDADIEAINDGSYGLEDLL